MGAQFAGIVKNDLGVATEYRHVAKRVTPREMIELQGAVLKWYAVHPADQDVPEDVTRLARTYLAKEPLDAGGLGFVLLHRCGNAFYFLIVCTWRNNNELWESLFYKNGDTMAAFAPFPREREHKPTLCVWELAPVWHEQQAWVRFLASSRDEAAARVWSADRYAGPA